MDLKSAFLYGTIEEEVYVCQPPGFKDPHYPDKVEKALYCLHQAPRAWYETLSTYLLENEFRRGIIDKTLFIKKDKGDLLSMIGLMMYLTASRPDIIVVVCACHPKDSPFDLEAFSDSDYAGASLDRKSTTGEYVAAANCCGQDGFVNRFVDNTIQVSRNNVVYFSAIPRDGIFEIDLSNSFTNESSIYAVSNKRAKLDLDSALLWHCQLGHISKKRIKSLQHDGLLNSSDLTEFEKCVSCMSGKMARKPYTHQVERAKDLLGLIHTDVCGPFKIMSRQEASYFVTFTDDFSRYGYVYLLKHKHEVFETFKVFQKEVENQL
nr:retrotransposon protein, putative, Ty1-copia subclass [Tanacetum cinerariifolium]